MKGSFDPRKGHDPQVETGRLGETYPTLPAAGARSHKYFWLSVWAEAESATELLGSKELSLKGNGRIGSAGRAQGLSGCAVPTLPRCHERCISNSVQGQEIQWTEAGRGNWAQGCQSCVFSMSLRSTLWPQLRTSVRKGHRIPERYLLIRKCPRV